MILQLLPPAAPMGQLYLSFIQQAKLHSSGHPPNGSAKRSERGNILYTKGPLKPCVYDDGYDSGQVSLLWGENEGFQRRLSRAINCVPPLSLFRPRSMGSAGQDSAWPWPDLQLVFDV